MSFFSPKPEQSTAAEASLLTALNNLSVGSSTLVIAKTGITTFTNVDLVALIQSYIPSSGANNALSNLASVAINAALIPDTAGVYNFGATTRPWGDIYFSGTSQNPTGNRFRLTGVATTGLQTITFPDASGAASVVYTNVVTLSSLASVGTITTGVWNGTIITSAYGGTGNGFTKFSGPAASEKTFTLPNASANVLTDNAAVTTAQGGTGVATFTANGVLYGNAAGNVLVTAQGGTNTILTASAGAPAWSATPIINTSVQLGVVSTTTGQLKLANASSANLTTIQAGNAANARTYTWPTDFGAAGTVLTDAAGNGTLSWAAASAGALVLEGSDNTERTTTSATNADLSTVTVSIGTTKGIWVKGEFRRSAANQVAKLAFRFNSTEIVAPSGGGLQVAQASGSANAVVGTFDLYIPPQDTNYLYGGTFSSQATEGLNGTSTTNTNISIVGLNNLPNATITSVVVEGQIGGGATLAIKNIRVYSMA